MAPKFSFFQVSFSAALLRNAAIAIALLAQASPVRAETLTLTCESTGERTAESVYESVKFQVDLNQQVIKFLDSGGRSIPNRSTSDTYPVQITDSSIKWNFIDGEGFPYFSGLIDRDSGNTEVGWQSRSGVFSYSFKGRCRRATQKF